MVKRAPQKSWALFWGGTIWGFTSGAFEKDDVHNNKLELKYTPEKLANDD